MRRGTIERTHPKLSVGAQCQLLSIARSSFYYTPQGETAMNLDLMLLVDKQFLDTPFYGVRQMTWRLQNEGHAVNEERLWSWQPFPKPNQCPISCSARQVVATAKNFGNTLKKSKTFL